MSKFKGADSPRIAYPAGQALWNTDYSYSKRDGISIDQTVNQTYKTGIDTFAKLVATAAANGSTEVRFSYRPGGYCTVSQSNRAQDISVTNDPVTGDPVVTLTQDTSSIISEVWSWRQVEEEIDIWDYSVTQELLDLIVPGPTGLGKNDRQKMWIQMAEQWLAPGGDPRYTKNFEDGSPLVDIYLSGDNILNQFKAWSPGSTTKNHQGVTDFLNTIATGLRTVTRSRLWVELDRQVPYGYTGVSNINAGELQYWTGTQVAAFPGYPAWMPLDPATKFLKHGATVTARNRRTKDLTVAWEEKPEWSTYLHPLKT